jgi:hypothetical protein
MRLWTRISETSHCGVIPSGRRRRTRRPRWQAAPRSPWQTPVGQQRPHLPDRPCHRGAVHRERHGQASCDTQPQMGQRQQQPTSQSSVRCRSAPATRHRFPPRQACSRPSRPAGQADRRSACSRCRCRREIPVNAGWLNALRARRIDTKDTRSEAGRLGAPTEAFPVTRCGAV